MTMKNNQPAKFDNAVLTIVAGSFNTTITVKDIETNWNNLSHFPERRARIELHDLAVRINDISRFLHFTAEQGGAVDGVAELETFARRHIERTRRLWALDSRCASWFITGPANFPTARNQKRQASRDKAADHVQSHVKATKKAITRRAWPYGQPEDAIRANNPDAPELLRAEIDKRKTRQEQMKAANAAIRAHAGDAEAMAQALVDAIGCSHTAAHELIKADRFGKRGFIAASLSNNLAEIKRLEQRLAIIEKNRERGEQRKDMQTSAGMVSLIENPEAARIQLIFDGKPSENVRSILKKAGLRWSPRFGAWQRHLNNAGRHAVSHALQQIG